MKFIVKSYGKKGEDVVNKNYAAVDRGGEYKQLAVDPAWANWKLKLLLLTMTLHSSTK